MPTLDLVLSPPNLQRLHDALACLGKFSEYVAMEASQNKLSLTALNSSKSTHGLITLGGRFFDTYHFIPTQGRSLLQSNTESKFTCKVLTKALLSVFRQRYVDSRDKETAIEKCELTIGDKLTSRGDCQLFVRLICKHGVVKLYKLNYEDVDVMHAIFDKESAHNHWTMNAKLFKEYLEHFAPKAEQLDISTEDGRATLTSFTEKLVDGVEILKQQLHTAVSVDNVEFEEFTVEEELHITINFKDFKAIVHHADSVNTAITAYYSEPGRPLQIQYGGEGMSCQFTLMTIGGNVRSIARASPKRHPPLSSPVSRQRSTTTTSEVDICQRASQLGSACLSRAESTNPVHDGSGQESLSLFFPPPEDEEVVPEYRVDKEPKGDFLEWDMHMDHNGRSRTVMPRNSSSNGQVEEQQYQDVEIIGPTQQVSQARGLFD